MSTLNRVWSNLRPMSEIETRPSIEEDASTQKVVREPMSFGRVVLAVFVGNLLFACTGALLYLAVR